ncbi:HIT family hydrolase, partial [bacterium]
MPESLWAPWRMEYISKADETNKVRDLFVALPAMEDDEAAHILHRGEHAFVLLNAYPYTSGHLMVAPYRKTIDLAGLSDAEHLEIAQLVARCTVWLTRAYKPQGFNIGVNLG